MNEQTNNEDEILFRKEFDEIIRQAAQSGGVFRPSYEDIIRYHSQKTKLLVNIDCYALPMEIQIIDVIDEGGVFQIDANVGIQWVKTEQVEVLHVFPPLALLHRMKEIERENNQAILDKAHTTNKVIGRTLDEIYKDFNNLGKKKKK